MKCFPRQDVFPVSLSLLVLLLASPAAAQLSPPWTVSSASGVSRNCSTGRPECALRLDPYPCGSRSKVTQALALSLEGGVTRISFSVLLDSTYGNTDSGFDILLDNGDRYTLGFSGGSYSPNNGVELVRSSSGSTQGTGIFTQLSAGTWHSITLTFDPVAGVTATVNAITSSALPAAGAASISSLEFNAVYWCGNSSTGFSFDSFGLSATHPF